MGRIVKNNLVILLAAMGALVSMVIVPSSMGYVEYLNGPVLGILFCLMVVIGGFRESGVFSVLLSQLLLRLGTFRQLAMVLVFINNPVAVISPQPDCFVNKNNILSQY